MEDYDITAKSPIENAKRRVKHFKQCLRDGVEQQIEWVKGLYPGVHNTVCYLTELGFLTCDSGDGVSKSNINDDCAVDFPHVIMICEPEKLVDNCDYLFNVLKTAGVKVSQLYWDGNEGKVFLEGKYSPTEGIGIIDLTGITDAHFKPPLKYKDKDV